MSERPASTQEDLLIHAMTGFFDPAWYQQRYPDIVAAGLDPMRHFIRHGIAERRDPNRFFDSAWYCEHYPDVNASGQNPLLHYLQAGAAELRNPHPRFDAVYYADQYPEAAGNPLLFHLRTGLTRGYPTEKPLKIADYLPSALPALKPPDGITVDVVIPVYRGLQQTRRCIESALADPCPELGRVIVIDDRSPDMDLVAWLDALAAHSRIHLIRNPRNAGFVTSVNRGMAEAGDHDVVLLNSDTEVAPGWLSRLTAQAYAAHRIATVSPFSNNATICGYPDNTGGPIIFGKTVEQIDALCRTANAGRWVDVPTTVGFCMYIRRDALHAVGPFDAARFTVGYGEENDFCLRASAAGWRHRLACDTFVYHEGSVSFGGRAEKLANRAMKLLLERYPNYARDVARHVNLGSVNPFRFALTAALLRQSDLPVILMISHNLGGGIRQHIDSLVARYQDQAHILLLEATDRGAALSVPLLPNHPSVAMPAERIDDLTLLLQSMNLARIHIHHLVGMDMDIRSLIRRLDLPFDVTVHDYYAICPQMNLLPRPGGLYCGEPGPADCNACIGLRPSYGARDILSWRQEHAWPFLDADRVLCPSNDVLSRLRHHDLAANTILAPHEPVASAPWPMRVSPPGSGKLRIAVLGVLADHKGARTVAALAETGRFDIHLIGHPESNFPEPALKRLTVTGEYQQSDLPALIERVAPGVIWFPGVWPETYSFTLSAAINSGLPIAATDVGAFPERLAGRPFTWLVPGTASPTEWAEVFETIRTGGTHTAPPSSRPAVADFYARNYLHPKKPPSRRVKSKRTRRVIAVVPERYENGYPTPCGYIRLLQPLDHPTIGRDFQVVLTDARAVLDCAADIIITQRYALPTLQSADALAGHARRTGVTLVYDLDDDLLNIPPTHPDAAALRPKAKIVRRMLDRADAVWLSTEGLASRLAAIRPNATVLANALDERIWRISPPARLFRDDPVRILCMGTSTHDRDFALIEPALVRLKAEFGDRVSIDVIGMTSQSLTPGLNRVGPPPQAGRSYPGFVNWLTSVQPGWHIGLAPLADTAFNRAKSPIKTMDYAAMGMVVLASDHPVYRGSLADGPAGQLVANTHHAWYAALEWLMRNHELRHSIADKAREAFLATDTLAIRGNARRGALKELTTR